MRSGQVKPAISAIAKSGSETSISRSLVIESGNAGSASRSRATVASFAHSVRSSRIGAAWADALRSRSRWIFSSGRLGSIRMGMQRSAVVSGSGWPMPARTFGENVENVVRTSIFGPDWRWVFPQRRQPELMMPQRFSACSFGMRSISSISTAIPGLASMSRNSAAGEMLAVEME